MSRVTVVGSANIDIVLNVATLPTPGETVIAGRMVERPGGKGANQALAAASQGSETTLLAAFGDDALGRLYREGLASHGVDVTRCRVIPDIQTGRAIVAIDALGENSIIVAAGANSLLDADAVSTAMPADSTAVLVQLEVPPHVVAAALRRAKELGAHTFLNASPLTAEAMELAALADTVIVNELEAAQLEGHPDLCVTLGARGAVWRGLSVAPPPVTPVDTTGAGDAFAGTLVSALDRGASPLEALQAAVHTSARAVTQEGAQPWTIQGRPS